MTTFTLIHVAISLIAIFSGFVVIGGLLQGNDVNAWTAIFLTMTLATSVTGFFYLPFFGFTPAEFFGVISTALLLLAFYGRSVRRLEGPWRMIYVISAVAAQYLNFFVLVVQSFQKLPALKAIAPTQSDPPFAITQGIVLLLFVGLGFAAVFKFRVKAGQIPTA